VALVVEHIAELTGYRDRDILDVSLVGAVRELLRPLSVAIHRAVGPPGQQRWLTRARLDAHDAVASADPLGVELDTLPPLAADERRHACMTSRRPAVWPGSDGMPTLALFPLITDRDVVGVLGIETREPLAEEQLRTVGAMLRIYGNFEGLLDYSERDTLTGLLNRKTFDDSFLRLARRVPATADDGAVRDLMPARRAGSDGMVWLGVVDIDHFKKVNDGHGHLIGDEVLLLLSRLMRSSFRFHDHLYRFGGEEFVVLMRCAQPADAKAAFERLRANVEAYAFPRVGRITVSVGVTEVRATDTPSVAFERADKAVYHAKQTGRNRVCDHAVLVASGVLKDEAHEGDVELF
jgi:diguanylate cyclase (GGDEF)-like protein